MPSYEVSLILRTLAKPEMAAVLKRSALKILENNGILFGIENLGTRNLPFTIKAHSSRHKEGSYFLIKFDGPTSSIEDLKDEYKRDVDIIRVGFARADSPVEFSCSLFSELQAPAYRRDVAELIEKGRTKEKQYDPQIGLPYNPWRT